MKIQMLAEAAKDAKIRATQIAASTGAKVGAFRSARMDVLQINLAGSSETSSEPNDDIKSIEKDVIDRGDVQFCRRMRSMRSPQEVVTWIAQLICAAYCLRYEVAGD